MLLSNAQKVQSRLKEAKLRPLSGQRRPERQGLSLARRVSVIVVVLSVCSASVGIALQSHYVAGTAAAIGLVGSVLAGVLLISELLLGAGWHIETQYVKGKADYFRKYSFQPSLNRSREVFSTLAAIVGGVVMSYGTLYFVLADAKAIAFSRNLTFLSAVYFSLVTFATIGYGDIFPDDDFARVLVGTQIVTSLALMSVVFAVSVSWLLSRQQQLQKEREEQFATRTQLIEDAMKEAGMGLYAIKNEIENAKGNQPSLESMAQENPDKES